MDRTELYRVSTQILENIINDEKNDNNILFDMDIWDWSQGVALYGIWKYYRLTGERRYLEYLTQWFDTKLNRPIVHNINTMAPLLTLCFLYEETGREEYRDYCESCAEWLLDGLPKTEMGGFQHVTIDSDNNQQLWADTVFMAVLFMGKIASITGDERYAGECKKQFMLHIHYLSDKKTGLWCHGWSFERILGAWKLLVHHRGGRAAGPAGAGGVGERPDPGCLPRTGGGSVPLSIPGWALAHAGGPGRFLS